MPPRQMPAIIVPLVEVPSYIPGGGRSFWQLVGLLLLVIGFLITLWLIWLGLHWIIKKLAPSFRRK
jgi:hypothetical protein